MASRFPIYMQLLKLYPKSYRQDYQQQMLQTLADMLDDQPDTKSKALVWIRTGTELPIGIVQQNITAIGETSMNKLSFTSNKRLVAVLSILVIIGLGLGLHNWARWKGVPGVTKVLYGHSVITALTEQNKNLQSPMVKLYGSPKLSKINCGTAAASGIQTEVSCQQTYTGYTKLAQDAAGKKNIINNAKAIDAALAAAGYHHGSNGVTLTSLISGTYQGKDYSPDAYYEKVSGPYDCVFDTMIAYANPHPPAINSLFWCARTINVFGTPKTETYNSHDGSPAY